MGTFVLGCSSEDDGLRYSEHVRPLFESCAICHRAGAPAGPDPGEAIDVLEPYTPEVGLVTSKNLWKMYHPEIDSPEYIVAPGDPENSFLIDKISDPALGRLPPEDAGEPMPLAIPPLTEEEHASIERWVLAGAEDTEQFRTEVVPIFGNTGRFEGRLDNGKCLRCHYEGTPNPPDLGDPFGPNGLVNVTALYRSDMVRVAPFDLEGSFLIAKVRAVEPTSEIGAPMPRSFPRLTGDQVDVVRQWIADGARP